MAKRSRNIGVKKIKVIVFNSDSEEQFMSNDWYWMHLPEYNDHCCFKKWRVRRSRDRAVSNASLNHTVAQYSSADLSPNCFRLTFTYELKHYFTERVDWVISISASYLWSLTLKNPARRTAITSKMFCGFHYSFQIQDMKPCPSTPTHGQPFWESVCVYRLEWKHSNHLLSYSDITQPLEVVMCERSVAQMTKRSLAWKYETNQQHKEM
jgi:hypothetical protein